MKINAGQVAHNAHELGRFAALPASGLAELTRQLADGVARWNRRQIEASELRRLDDRLLEDIGLTRYDLDRAA
jgi:uncharacterized protein YjiS (DUF1127 family)